MLSFGVKTDTLVAISHALATWVIVGLTIWAIWWADFGERAAMLLKTEVIEERHKVSELRQSAAQLRQLLTDREIALQEYEKRRHTLAERVRNYETQVTTLKNLIERHMQQAIDDSLRSWAGKAGEWMTGHKVRAEVGSKWGEHIAWMNALQEWRKGTPIPSGMPYIWNLGLIREDGRGNWIARMLRMKDCGKGAAGSGMVSGREFSRSSVEEWLVCGEMFEREYLRSVSTTETGGIYTVRDLIASIEAAEADAKEDTELARRTKERLLHVLETHNIVETMPLRMKVDAGAAAKDIIAEGQMILANYDKFEDALEALKKRQ